MANKLPLGIEPEKAWKERRLNDLYSAMHRYIDSDLTLTPNFLKWRKESEKLEVEIELMDAEN